VTSTKIAGRLRCRRRDCVLQRIRACGDAAHPYTFTITTLLKETCLRVAQFQTPIQLPRPRQQAHQTPDRQKTKKPGLSFATVVRPPEYGTFTWRFWLSLAQHPTRNTPFVTVATPPTTPLPFGPHKALPSKTPRVRVLTPPAPENCARHYYASVRFTADHAKRRAKTRTHASFDFLYHSYGPFHETVGFRRAIRGAVSSTHSRKTCVI